MRNILLVVVLAVVSGCAQGPAMYQCEADSGSSVPSLACDPGDAPEGAGWVYWQGCLAPDTWLVGHSASQPQGVCSVGFRQDVIPPAACDGVHGGDTLCDFGCGWVREPSADECDAMRADCPSGVCEYEAGATLR
jgi:hypothetical protein